MDVYDSSPDSFLVLYSRSEYEVDVHLNRICMDENEKNKR